jgi:hypothetical protein
LSKSTGRGEQQSNEQAIVQEWNKSSHGILPMISEKPIVSEKLD